MPAPNGSRDRGTDAITPRADSGGLMTMADIARTAQAEHNRLVELLMETVDLLDHAQKEGGKLVNMPVLREGTGRVLRTSAAMHVAAVADLMDVAGFELTDDRKYRDELAAYSSEIMPKDEDA
jgi:hypothetical protein